MALVLTGCVGSTVSTKRPNFGGILDDRLRTECASPVRLPMRKLTQAEVERYWKKDRLALVKCAGEKSEIASSKGFNQMQILEKLGNRASEIADSGMRLDGGATGLGKYLASELGMTMIGSGSFGAVLNHPVDPHKVIKIGYSGTGRFPEDGWAEFATQTMMMEPSKYLPKIYSIHLYPSVYVAEMERRPMIRHQIVYTSITG